ncbi:TPA: hypothetical protein SML50_003314 [Serratia fonticola]|nr:hypothetical protein [Serratia fonticola]
MENPDKDITLSSDYVEQLDKIEIKRQRDAANKEKQNKKYIDSGFSRIKIYLGRSTIEKLADIYEDQRGKPLNIDGRKDIDSLSQVISFCINKTYEQLYAEEEEQELPTTYALPANNARSQELYDRYQTASYWQSNGLSDTAIKNKLNKEGYRPPNRIPSTIPGLKSNGGSPLWTVQQVKDLLDFEILNADLNDLNE